MTIMPTILETAQAQESKRNIPEEIHDLKETIKDREEDLEEVEKRLFELEDDILWNFRKWIRFSTPVYWHKNWRGKIKIKEIGKPVLQYYHKGYKQWQDVLMTTDFSQVF